MSKLVAFSYSRITSYEQCPRKFHAVSVAKSVKEEESGPMAYGKELHLAFANYIKKGTPLPLHLKQYEKYLAAIKKATGTFIVEQQLAINANYEATGWFDKDVYCRIISDLTILNGKTGVMWDYKTGKLSKDFTQLRLAAAVMFLLVPELEKIVLAYLWTKTKEITRETITRDEMPGVWTDLLPRIQRYQDAHHDNNFPPKPNPFCKGCVVNTCQYYEARR